jgi:flagellar basal-body rod protein FlgB
MPFSFGNFDRTIGVLQKVLDFRLQKQQVIASNIANADTPGYTPARLEFEKELRQAVNAPSIKPSPASHAAHFPLATGDVASVQPRIVREPSVSVVGDRNGVNVDEEMVSLAENQIMYEAAVDMLNKKLGLLKYVSQGGR